MFRNLLFFLATKFLIGCSEPYIDAPEAEVHGSIFSVRGIPAEATDRPTIAHINIVNLDQNGVNDVLVCDDQVMDHANGEQQFNTALNHLEIANALQPNNPRILAALGFSWFKLEEESQSVLFLENAVKLAPTFALGWFHL